MTEITNQELAEKIGHMLGELAATRGSVESDLKTAKEAVEAWADRGGVYLNGTKISAIKGYRSAFKKTAEQLVAEAGTETLRRWFDWVNSTKLYDESLRRFFLDMAQRSPDEILRLKALETA